MMEYKSTERIRQHCTLTGVTKHIHRRKGKKTLKEFKIWEEKNKFYIGHMYCTELKFLRNIQPNFRKYHNAIKKKLFFAS